MTKSILVSALLVLIISSFPQPSLQLDLDYCDEDVGLENGLLPDSSLSASSSYDPLNVGAEHGRLGQDTAGGAWCPQGPVGPDHDQQWLGVNLTQPHVIRSILTQGRYAQGQGQEYTMAFQVYYWREGMMTFREYRDSMGRNILHGNSDTFNVATNKLNPPLIASAIRIYPYSNHSRTVCLRLGLNGCVFEENLLSYDVPQGMVRGATLELLDITYDGLEDSLTGFLTGGLGQLTDGKYGLENYRAVGENGLVRGYEWVGWKNKSMGPLQMDFTFLNIRKFDQVLIHINNHYTKDIQIFSRAKIYFSNEEGKFGDDRAVDYIYMPDRMVEDARNVSINLHGEHGQYVMMQLFFADKWMLISEITFISESYQNDKIEIPSENERVFEKTTENLENLFEVIEEEEREESSITPETSTVQFSAVQTETPQQDSSSHAGLIIGILLTIISFLVGAILYVVYQARLRADKNPPSHSHHSAACLTDKIQKKLAASLDFTEDFTATYKAKMRVYGQVSARDDEANNFYATATRGTGKYEPSTVLSDCVSDDYAVPHIPHKNSRDRIYQSVNNVARPAFSHSSLSSPSSVEASQARVVYNTNSYHQPTYQKVKKYRHSSTHHGTSSQNIYHSLENCHSMSQAYCKQVMLPVKTSAQVNVVRKSQLKIVERLGAGKFGEAHLCYFIGNKSSALVVVKSLDTSCSFEKRRQFQEEARTLSQIHDENIAPVLGGNFEDDPWFVVREFSEQGDLTQFLQNHVAESSATKMSDIPTLSYGALIYMSSQIASGMKCLESFNFVHGDLAARNCQVYSGYQIKISDTGSMRTVYSEDYYHSLPIRWMAWESVIKGVSETKSDCWSFGVTLWEILTFARETPYEALTDKEVLHNLNELSDNSVECLGEVLHQPYNCPRDVYELMLECWSKEFDDRPDFQEIYLFLMRKNLGYEPTDDA